MDKRAKLYERALISCILMLFICIIFKLFGANWFDLETNISILNKLNNIIMNNLVLSFVFSFTLTFISGILIISISTMKHNFLIYIMSFISTIIAVFSEYFIDNSTICIIIDILVLYFSCVIINKESKISCIICLILNFIFQLISLILRGVYIDTEYFNVIILTIMNLDYYILLIITLLYLKKGEKNLCLVMGAFSSSLRKKLWKKHILNLKQSSNKGG